MYNSNIIKIDVILNFGNKNVNMNIMEIKI
jgi:hypothetical protein